MYWNRMNACLQQDQQFNTMPGRYRSPVQMKGEEIRMQHDHDKKRYSKKPLIVLAMWSEE